MHDGCLLIVRSTCRNRRWKGIVDALKQCIDANGLITRQNLATVNSGSGRSAAMSSGIALVRFGDGTVKVGNYHGTSDLLVPRLFDTAMEATNAYFEGRDGWSDPEGDVEDVVVYVDHGGSFWFEAKATRTSVLPEYCDPRDASSEDKMGRRDPSRVLVEVHDGEPDWATEWFGRRLLG